MYSVAGWNEPVKVNQRGKTESEFMLCSDREDVLILTRRR